MSNITYTRNGSASTRSIAKAPHSIRTVWNQASDIGVNVLRVRVAQERNEVTQGNTFNGYHKGKVSIYKQRKNPIEKLWFRRFVKLNESNKGMQVLEVANNVDVEDTLRTIDNYNSFINGNIFVRMFHAVKNVIA